MSAAIFGIPGSTTPAIGQGLAWDGMKYEPGTAATAGLFSNLTVTNSTALGGTLTVAGNASGGAAMFGGTLSTAIRFSFGSLTVPPTWATGTVQNGFLGQFCATSACTGRLVCFTSRPGLEASAFTCGVVEKFFAQLTNIGAGAAATQTFGFLNRPDTAGTNGNVGFFQGQETDAVAGNWALYFNTTDPSWFGGNVTSVGNITAGDGVTGVPGAFINGAAGTDRRFWIQTAGVKRWGFGGQNSAEGGANAGTNFRFSAYDDAGTIIDNVISITRAAGGEFGTTRPFHTASVAVSSSVSTGAIICDGGIGAAGAAYIGGAVVLSSATALSLGSTTLLQTSVSLTNGAAAAVGSLLNAPAAGNPTKWIPINDNGTTRYIPAW